MKLNILSL